MSLVGSALPIHVLLSDVLHHRSVFILDRTDLSNLFIVFDGPLGNLLKQVLLSAFKLMFPIVLALEQILIVQIRNLTVVFDKFSQLIRVFFGKF